VDAPVDAPEPVARQTDPRALLPDGLVFADLYTRFAAYFLDGLLLAALTSIPPAVLGMYDTSGTYPPEPTPRATFIGTSIFAVAVQAAYFLWFWTGGRRATPGQRAFHVQVGNAFDGEPLTMGQAIVRWLAMGWWVNLLVLLPFFGLAVVAYVANIVWWVILGISIALSPTKQGIHDRLAHSALVRPVGPTSRWAIGCLWLMVGLLVLEGVLVVLLVIFVNSAQQAGLYPPGLDPWLFVREQIREFWPA
jgi:uncharacterized RDD family membrane protein YckC